MFLLFGKIWYNRFDIVEFLEGKYGQSNYMQSNFVQYNDDVFFYAINGIFVLYLTCGRLDVLDSYHCRREIV